MITFTAICIFAVVMLRMNHVSSREFTRKLDAWADKQANSKDKRS